MLSIALFHNHYDAEHLEKVKKEMVKLGSPTIRCFHDDANGIEIAFEGCHRIRAAKELNLIPVINYVEYTDIIDIQMDDELQSISVADLLDSINISNCEIVDFETYED